MVDIKTHSSCQKGRMRGGGVRSLLPPRLGGESDDQRRIMCLSMMRFHIFDGSLANTWDELGLTISQEPRAISASQLSWRPSRVADDQQVMLRAFAFCYPPQHLGGLRQGDTLTHTFTSL